MDISFQGKRIINLFSIKLAFRHGSFAQTLLKLFIMRLPFHFPVIPALDVGISVITNFSRI